MTPAERQSFWADRIRSWKASGLSPNAYARGKGFSGQSLRYWGKRLGLLDDAQAPHAKTRTAKTSTPARAPARSAPPRFVKVVPAKASTDELLLEFGPVRLRVRKGFDPDLLRAVVLTLSEKP